MSWRFDPLICDLVWSGGVMTIMELAEVDMGDQETSDLLIDIGLRENSTASIDQGLRVIDGDI